ncbi:hypothetical protein [Longispora albida]|uniref:hypothetical protein n=1 Tax=Longispora albida TaxID=203523 RepID=UPI0003686A98|nr:hypothetical protein [Longispora albida]
MTTIATPAMRQFADAWETAIASAVCSGIVGDPAHARTGGYHISREDQPTSNYSVQLPEDRAGQATWASAVDMNMNPADMRLVTGRLLASAKDQNDPRLNYCREFYGTLNGRDVTGWDTYHGHPATSDDSHLWHVHISFLRQHAGSPEAMSAVLSVITGNTSPNPEPVKEPEDVDPVQDFRLKLLFDNWAPSRADWVRAGGDGAVYDQAAARGGAVNSNALAHSNTSALVREAQAAIGALTGKVTGIEQRLDKQATGGIDPAALAAAVAPYLPKPPTAAEVAKAVLDAQAARLKE